MDQNWALLYKFAKLWWNLYSSGNVFLNCGNRAIASNVRFVKNESTLWKCVLKVYKDFWKHIWFSNFAQETLLMMKGLSESSPFPYCPQIFFQCLLVWNACNTWKSLAAEGSFSSPAILHLLSLLLWLISITDAPWYKNEWSYPVLPTFKWTTTISLPHLAHPLEKKQTSKQTLQHLSLKFNWYFSLLSINFASPPIHLGLINNYVCKDVTMVMQQILGCMCKLIMQTL